VACHSYGPNGMRVSFPVRQMLRPMSDSISRNVERLSYAAASYPQAGLSHHRLSRDLTHAALPNATNTSLEEVGRSVGGCCNPRHHCLYRSQRPFLHHQQIKIAPIVVQVKMVIRSEGDKLDHHRLCNTNANTTQRTINLCRLHFGLEVVALA
jgi:hypothetical protein